MKRVGLSHQVSTHVAQNDHKETEEELSHFMALMRQKVGTNPDDVINMDQTPILYTSLSNCTLENKGLKTIHVQTSMTDTKPAAFVVTVLGNGKMLTPVLILKGNADG